MSGWKTVGVVIEGHPILIGGLNVWDHDWNPWKSTPQTISRRDSQNPCN